MRTPGDRRQLARFDAGWGHLQKLVTELRQSATAMDCCNETIPRHQSIRAGLRPRNVRRGCCCRDLELRNSYAWRYTLPLESSPHKGKILEFQWQAAAASNLNPGTLDEPHTPER